MNDESSSGRGEEGFLSLASLFAVLGLVIGFALLANVGKTIGRKLETQNAADAAATGAGIELARGMNAVTAANHLIGELHALVVLHHALGGDPVDGLKKAEPTPQGIKNNLKFSYDAAKTLSQIAGIMAPVGFNDLSQEPREGAAIYDSRIELKKVTTWAYIAHAIGSVFKLMGNFPIPIVSQILTGLGYAVVIAAMAFEYKAWSEWYVLDGLYYLSKATVPFKKSLQYAVIPGLYGYSCIVAGAVPGFATPLAIPGKAGLSAEEAAGKLGQYHQAEATLFPGLGKNTSLPLLALPVVAEPKKLKHPERSQLIRASTPWIQRWRLPWLHFGEDALLLSRFKCHYLKYTDEYTIEMTRRAKELVIPVNLLVIRELKQDGSDKGKESWAREGGSGTADQLFGTMAFAHRPKSEIASFGYYRQPNPDGFLAFAQTMIYNANPQKPDESRRGFQKRVGWDTLNWSVDVPEYPGPGGGGETCPIPTGVPEPRIKLNWQAKLVPTTRLPESMLWQREPAVKSILKRTAFELPGLTNTH